MGKKATIENDRNVEKDTTPEAKKEGRLAKVGSWFKNSGKAVADAVVTKVEGATQPFVEINERAERGEKIKVTEVLGTVAKTGLDVGLTVGTGGTDKLAGVAISQLSDVAVKSNLVSEGTGDNIKHGLKIVVDPKEALKESLMNKSIKFAKENDPTNTTQTIETATDAYKSLKKPQKISDVSAASNVVAKISATKNKMVSVSTAEQKWKSYIRKKLDAVDKYLQDNGAKYKFQKPDETYVEYNGVKSDLKQELTDALFSIYKRNSSAKTFFLEYIQQARKLKLLVDFYSRPDVRAVIDGRVSFPEEFYLSHFMKQYLTHNGIFNMPPKPESGSSTNMLAFGAGENSYAGANGIKVELINPSQGTVYKNISTQTDSAEHRTGGLTDLVIQAKDADGNKLQEELKFSEYLGENAKSGNCPDDSCKKCGSYDRILKDTIQCEFTYDDAMQIWFKVKDIENEGDAGDTRGFYFPESEITKNFRKKAAKFILKPDNKNNVA